MGEKPLSEWTYVELEIEARRLGHAIEKDENYLENLGAQMKAGKVKIPGWKLAGNPMARADALRALREKMGYKLVSGGLEHPLAERLTNIREELKRRDRFRAQQALDKFLPSKEKN